MGINEQFRIELRKNIYEFEHSKTYQLFTTSLILAITLLGLAITLGSSVFFGFLIAFSFFFLLLAKDQRERSLFLTSKVINLVKSADSSFDVESELRDSVL